MKIKYRTYESIEASNKLRLHLAHVFSWWRIHNLNVTQNKLVADTKVARSVISDIEVGTRTVRLETLAAIADKYGYDVIIEFRERKNGNGKS